MNGLIYRLKQAWASLARKPGFSLTVIGTIGLTLGALVGVLTLGYLLLAKPLPYADQERLVYVSSNVKGAKGEDKGSAFTYPGLIDLYKNHNLFEQIAVVAYTNNAVMTSLPHQPSMHVTLPTPEWFAMTQAKLHLGRYFSEVEGLDDFTPVAIIAYHLWQEEFASDPDILNNSIEINGQHFQIIGVMAEDYYNPQIYFTGRRTAVWLPFDYHNMQDIRENWGVVVNRLKVLAKLPLGVSVSQAEQSLTERVDRLWQENVAGIDFFDGWSIEIELVLLKQRVLGNSKQVAWLIIAGVAGLALIALANISNLFMARTVEKQRQLAILAALGAKVRQLFNHQFTEAFLLMLASMLLALLVASSVIWLFQQHLESILPRINELQLDWTSLFSAFFLSLLFAWLFAWVSSKSLNYRKLAATLQASGKGSGLQVSKRLRQILVVSQVAIASVLVFANLLLFGQAMNTINLPLGTNINNIHHLGVSYAASERPNFETREQLMRELTTKLSALPQVEQLSQSTSPLQNGGLWALTVAKTTEKITPHDHDIDDQYLSMLDIPLIAGRNFSAEEFTQQADVMLVNKTLAEQLSPDGQVLGWRIGNSRRQFTVVGVIGDVMIPGQNRSVPRVYTTQPALFSFMLKVKPGQQLDRKLIAIALSSTDKRLVPYNLQSLDDWRDNILFVQYTTAVTTLALCLLTMLLASAGLYGILSYGIQMRRFELGTRMAIGAKGRDLIKLIIGDNLSVILLGLGIGLVILLGIYLGFSQQLAPMLGLNLLTTYGLTLLGIAALSLFACYWPLRQFIRQPAVYSLRNSE